MQGPQLAFEDLLLQNLSNADTPSRGLVAIAGTNALTGSPNLAATQLGLFQPINHRVEIEADMRAVRNENPLARVLETFRFEGGELLEETGDVDDGSGADEVNAGRGNQSGGEDMEVVGGGVVDDCVAGICQLD